MPGSIGPLEIGIVLLIALLVFGPRRLPELGGSLGRGIREFTKSVTGDAEKRPALNEAASETESAPKPAALAER